MAVYLKMNPILIQLAEPKEATEIANLFAETILFINKAHYSLEQVTLWASAKEPLQHWQSKIITQYFVVAKMEDKIVGFSSLEEETTYLDLLYVHKDYQKRGIAKKLLQALETRAKELEMKYLHTQSSITARPFFESQGFSVVKQQEKVYKNLTFCNFVMEKYFI